MGLYRFNHICQPVFYGLGRDVYQDRFQLEIQVQLPKFLQTGARIDPKK